MFVEFKDIAAQKLSAGSHRLFHHYPDVFEKMVRFTRAKLARAMGYYPYYPKIEQSDATEVVMDGEKKIMLGSNNYLGLTNHPDIIQAGVDALRTYGSGLTGSRLLNGNITLHDELESRLADFVHKESALVFSTGFAVNLGVIATTVGKDDLLFSDELNHASIVDGARFSRVPVRRYKHNDMTDLENELKLSDPKRGRFIVTDGIFSMEGDIVRLPDMLDLAKRYHTRVMVDEAHALGVLGPNGEGTAAHFGLQNEADLIMGTFSKSLGSVGGFITGDNVVIDYLKHHTRTMIFTASLPPANTATVMKALDVIQTEPERREQLWENTTYMLHELQSMGYDTGFSETPVIPLIIGSDKKTFYLWKELLAAGVYTNPIIEPAVPKGRSLLRTSYMATHTRDQLDFALEQFERFGKKYKVLNRDRD